MSEVPKAFLDMERQCVEEEHFRPEYFYFEVRTLPDGCEVLFSTKWDYARRDFSSLADGGYFRHYPPIEMEEEAGGIGFVGHRPAEEVAEKLIAAGYERRSGLFEVYDVWLAATRQDFRLAAARVHHRDTMSTPEKCEQIVRRIAFLANSGHEIKFEGDWGGYSLNLVGKHAGVCHLGDEHSFDRLVEELYCHLFSEACFPDLYPEEKSNDI